jgi:hypothetical protein
MFHKLCEKIGTAVALFWKTADLNQQPIHENVERQERPDSERQAQQKMLSEALESGGIGEAACESKVSQRELHKPE